MVISHWCHLIEGLQASPLDFYKCLEGAVDNRKVPGLARSHIIMPEGGFLSAKREYLRLTREKLLFDVCAAPFGTGFFVSCRLVDREFPWHLLILAIFVAGGFLLFLFLLMIAVTNGFMKMLAVATVVSVPVVVIVAGSWLAWWLLRGVFKDIDAYLLMFPAFGRTYERWTRRNTYYRIDLICAFHAAVQAALMEVIDKHTEAQKLAPLSEWERKPVMSELLLR